jgi:hypothetical protein
MNALIKQAVRPVRRAISRLGMPDMILKNLHPLYLAADFVCAEEVPGDYLEFGVFRGASFLCAYHAMTAAVRDWGSRRRAALAYSDPRRAEEAFSRVVPRQIRYFAFDSFAGLPDPVGLDTRSARFSKGRYDCSQEEFGRLLARSGVDLRSVVIVPGFYEQTLTAQLKQAHHLTAASIVMIDCDLYASAGAALEFVSDLVVEGTVLIFDDWLNFKANPELGEQRACREWLQKHPEFRLTPFARWGVTQQSFIVHRSEAGSCV